MNIAQKTVLITGANRGIGRALVQEALRRGAKRLYAGTRGPLDIVDERVTPLMLDVTNAEQIEQAVRQVGSLDVLVNNLSLMALAPLPLTPSYAISKAAALSMTQSLRALLASEGVTVHGVFLGPVDTDMTRGFEIPKASPESVAQGIFNGLESSEEDIFPDPASQSIAEGWRTGVAKEFERQYAGFVPQSAVAL